MIVYIMVFPQVKGRALRVAGTGYKFSAQALLNIYSRIARPGEIDMDRSDWSGHLVCFPLSLC